MKVFHRNFANTDYKSTKYHGNTNRQKATDFFGILFLGIAWGLIVVEIIIQAGN